jgi:alanine racemase
MPDAVLAVVQKISRNKAFIVHGLCTHFAESSSDDWEYTKIQRERFLQAIHTLALHNLQPPLRHADKSTSAMRYANDTTNGVRIGAGLYGLLPDQGLRQVMTWKSRIAALRPITQDSPLGYAQTYRVFSGQKIAFIPVGYYDGYDRRLSNCGKVLVVRGSLHENKELFYAPVIGRVTMNTITIDISHIPYIGVGDEVIILGDYPGLRAWDSAEITKGGNPRDVIVKVRAGIERIVVE